MKHIFFLFMLLAVTYGTWAQAPRLVVPIGHTAWVNAVAMSPVCAADPVGGKYVLTGSEDGTAKLWDRSGREIQTFEHGGAIRSVAFSPDGKTMATGGIGENVRIWDLNGKLIRAISGHQKSIFSVVFSPDGKHILTGSGDNTAKLWSIDGREILTFSGHSNWVRAVSFSPDGKSILTASQDNSAKLWTIDGKEIRTFSGHYYMLNAVAFSPDGKYFATGGDQIVKLRDLNGKEIAILNGHAGGSGIRSVVFSPDGKSILTASSDRTAKLWDLSGKEIHTFKGHSETVISAVFSPDGQLILTGSADRTAQLWDLSGNLIQLFQGHSAGVSDINFAPDGTSIVTANGDSCVRLWLQGGRIFRSLKGHGAPVTAACFSPDGTKILSASTHPDPTARLWQLNGKQLCIFQGHKINVVSAVFSPDGKSVLTASLDNSAKLWNLNGQELQTFQDKLTYVRSAVFSKNGKSILTANEEKVAMIWDVNGKPTQVFKGHTEKLDVALFSPDGRYVLTGSRDSTARLWLLDGKEITSFVGHSGSVQGVCFSPDGQFVVTGSGDKTIRLWELSGKEIRSFKGHGRQVSGVRFSPDGKFIISCSPDNTTKLWSPATGQERATLIALDASDWVVTTPSGLFDASPGAMKRMHYIVGLDVVELDQLKERYYEPGLLAKVMGLDNGELRNVTALTQVALYPEIAAAIENDRLTVNLTERGGGLGKLSLFINGKEVQEDINPKRLKAIGLDLNAFGNYYRADASNAIALRAYNREGWLKSQAYELSYRPGGAKGANKPGAPVAKPPALAAKPSLYALVVGTSNYAGNHLDLRFADQDAQAIAAALKDAGSALFGPGRVSVHLLSTAAAEVSSKANIQKAFGDIAAKARPEDVLVVYFSGHGLAYGPAEKEQFYYLTKDIGSEDLSDPEVRKNFTVSSDLLTQWLTAIPAQKQVLILDACNAGKVVESLAAAAQKNLNPSQIRALDRMKDRTGMFILTGAAADKVSYEASQYGQGLLTYSLLQGMSGLALTDDNRVDVMQLFQYARDQVPELAKGIGGIQTPVLAFPAGGGSFDIGIVNAGVKIPVAQVKPVFIRNNFTNEATFDDDLKLTDTLEDYFRELTAKGAQADIIFVDVKEYENAYSMKGRYTLHGDAVTVRGRLFKGAASQGEFQVTGNKSDLKSLVAAIVDRVSGMVK